MRSNCCFEPINIRGNCNKCNNKPDKLLDETDETKLFFTESKTFFDKQTGALKK